MRECLNPECRLRIPDDLDSSSFFYCPHCGSEMKVECSFISSGIMMSHLHFKNQNNIHLILDNIRSAYNVGSILRTAEGFGVTQVHICGITQTPEHAKIKKTSLGSENTISWDYCKNGLHIVTELKNAGCLIYCLESVSFGKPIIDISPLMKKPIALVCGNELTGIDPAILSICHEIIEIPMSGVKSSFNVAVATGIALFFLRYQA